MKRLVIGSAMAVGLTLSGGSAAFASDTIVPGHAGKESGTVMGKYTALYVYDASGAWYQDLGDGRVDSSEGVSSIEDLDQATLTVCDYQVVYQGDFGGDPFLNTGWTRNNVMCSGYDGTSTYNTLILHQSDHRYSEDLEPIWGDWGYFVDTTSGVGNVAHPQHHVGS